MHGSWRSVTSSAHRQHAAHRGFLLIDHLSLIYRSIAGSACCHAEASTNITSSTTTAPLFYRYTFDIRVIAKWRRLLEKSALKVK